jgi:hypothetical protein
MTPEQIEQLKQRYASLGEEIRSLDVAQSSYKVASA